MVKISALFLFLTSALCLNAAAGVNLNAVTDRPDALYEVGEEATFTITASDDGKPVDGEVKLFISKDGVEPKPQTLNLKDGKASVKGKLDEPGFLSLRASMGRDVIARAAAAYAPGQIKPSMPAPDDFDAFWAAQKEKLAAIPMDAKLTPKLDNEAVNTADLELYDVQLACDGAPVSGYFVRPKNAAKGSLPAILTLQGAGVRSATVEAEWAAMEGGMLALNINAHGIPNGEPEAYYEALSRNELHEYSTRGRASREESYLRMMVLRVLRAIDFLAEQPEWDGKTIVLYGSSQGGFQALGGAALDPRVSLVCAGVPAGCEHSGFTINRATGWPKLAIKTPEAKPDLAVLEAARYVDAVNFAARIKAREAVVTVGFVDISCPPTTVYAGYNALNVPKKIHADPRAGHASTPESIKFMVAAVREHIREMKAEGAGNQGAALP